MSAASKKFFDTNVLLYLLSADSAKAQQAEELVAQRGWVSVQVLNEFASVASRKLRMPLSEIRECLEPIRSICAVEPITVETHARGLDVAEHCNLSIHDAMIVAAALLAGCDTLYSEDLQDGQRIDGLLIRNPFSPASGKSKKQVKGQRKGATAVHGTAFERDELQQPGLGEEFLTSLREKL